jgi:hypothetical protein
MSMTAAAPNLSVYLSDAVPPVTAQEVRMGLRTDVNSRSHKSALTEDVPQTHL